MTIERFTATIFSSEDMEKLAKFVDDVDEHMQAKRAIEPIWLEDSLADAVKLLKRKTAQARLVARLPLSDEDDD